MNRANPTRIMHAICDLLSVSVSEVFSRSRAASVMEARVIHAGVCREFGYSYPDIATTFNASHTSILHRMERWMVLPKRYRDVMVARVRTALGIGAKEMRLDIDIARSVCLEARELLRANGHAKRNRKQAVIENLDAVILGKYPPHEVAA